MKKKLLTIALLGAALTQIASAQDSQDFDDRWFLTGDAGFNLQDNARETDDAPMLGLGFGKFFAPNWSFEVGLNHQNPNFNANKDLNFSQYGISADVKRHFMQEDSNWGPYLKAGIGMQRAEEEFAIPLPTSPGQRRDNSLAVELGAGLMSMYDNYGMRFEVGTRLVTDDQTVVAPDEDYFADLYAKAGVIVPLGAKAAPPPPPPPPAPEKTCADMDDDGDGVNNCDDKCPASQAGQAVGPDGCPVPLTIDLKGVNFDFDKSTLRPDAVSILTEAVEILKKYPELKVEVAGHTDARGTDAYNQSLSERRARVVYDYLTSNGVDASRLVGPTGFGESRPIDSNDTDEGRARNRRTELNVQN